MEDMITKLYFLNPINCFNFNLYFDSIFEDNENFDESWLKTSIIINTFAHAL